MSLEEWLKKNCPDDGPKHYSFNYEKYKRDTVNEQKKHKEFFVTKMEKIVETTILDEFNKVTDTPGVYVVDDRFLEKLILKIKGKM